jgi:hypothetical protein
MAMLLALFQAFNLCDVSVLTWEDPFKMIRKEVVVAYYKVGLLSSDLS